MTGVIASRHLSKKSLGIVTKWTLDRGRGKLQKLAIGIQAAKYYCFPTPSLAYAVHGSSRSGRGLRFVSCLELTRNPSLIPRDVCCVEFSQMTPLSGSCAALKRLVESHLREKEHASEMLKGYVTTITREVKIPAASRSRRPSVALALLATIAVAPGPRT